MLKNRLLLAVPLLLGSLALAGCDQSGGTGPLADGEARVSLLLTDAPSDLEAAVVTITDVYLQGEGGENGGRVYLRQGDPITTDLLTLQNDVVGAIAREVRAIMASRSGFAAERATVDDSKPVGT